MSEFRKDPVSGRWVIIASERSKRPRSLNVATASSASEPCPFCAGNEAMTPPEVFVCRNNRDQLDLPGWSVRVVPNKYPALEQSAAGQSLTDGLHESTNGSGVHEVFIESPDHVTDMTELGHEQFARALSAYQQRLRHWRTDPRWRYLIVYKNQGVRAGATLEHVHSQFMVLPAVPPEIVVQLDGMKKYYTAAGQCVYCDMIEREIVQRERLVSIDERFVALCPFAPRFAYETWILPRAHAPLFEQNSEPDIFALARLVRETLMRLNLQLGKPPYNYVIHTAPVEQSPSRHYHWHLEILPQLTRAAGFEWGSGMHINPVTPEAAARSLRDAAV